MKKSKFDSQRFKDLLRTEERHDEKSRGADAHRAMSRRAFLQWTTTVGAALGVARGTVLDIVAKSAGVAFADEVSGAVANRSVHIVAGTGGFAWFQLLWPHNDIAAAGNDEFAWHAPGQTTLRSDTFRPLTVGPHTPWTVLPGERQVTALMAGVNETHTRTPVSNLEVSDGVGMLAACAAVQAASPSLTPVVAIGDVPYGGAVGAPTVTRVGSADDFAQLFNSAASQAGGLLSNRANADLFQAQYSAWHSLRRASRSSSFRQGSVAGPAAARLLGENLADALRVTPDDLTRYGMTAASEPKMVALARSLAVTAKAFALGLTNSVIVPAFNDDPHGAFASQTTLLRTLTELRTTLNAFYEDLSAVADESRPGTIAENTVVSIHGDTPKNPLVRAAWPDGTPQNSNWIYVLGAGHLRSGWFGGVSRNGSVQGWDPSTGANAAGISSATTARPAAAAVVYAVARGNERRLQDFYRGPSLSGVVRTG